MIDGDVQDGTNSTGPPTGEYSTEALHDGTDDGRKAFLASFTAREDQAIMRKVDMRFLWLIGITYLIKNSKALLSQESSLLVSASMLNIPHDARSRLHQCRKCQGPPSRPES